MNRSKIREQGFFCVYQSLLLKQDIDKSINNQTENIYIENNQKEEILLRDDYFFRTITENVFNNKEFLIEKIDQNLIDWQFNRLGYIEQAILLIGAAEIYSENTDKKVIINESVELAKKYGEDESYKLINGVLDNL